MGKRFRLENKMNFKKEQIQFESECKYIIGKTIIKVEYAEIAYDKLNDDKNIKPYYLTYYKNVHTVDFAVFFYTETGDIIEVHWDDKFFQFGIGVKLNEVSDFSGYQKWIVSNNEVWKKFIGFKIKDIKITWEKIEEKIDYPQDITLFFSNDERIFISAASFLSEGDSTVFGMSDNLIVTDDEELARKIKAIS